MKILSTMCFIFCCYQSVLCITEEQGRAHKELPNPAKIQINVPNEPHPGTRTKVVTYNVKIGRHTFVELFKSTKQIGMCNPQKIEKSNDAHEVMTVSYRSNAVKKRWAFHILKDSKGEWITNGYGKVVVYDSPKGFPEYRYNIQALNAVKAWYDKHVPLNYRKITQNPHKVPETLPQKTDYRFSERDAKIKGLWKDFYKMQIKHFGKIQKIDTYAENNSLTKICFICNKSLYIFSWLKTGGRIERIHHAQLILYDRINKITFEECNGFGRFILWSDRRKMLSIGGPPTAKIHPDWKDAKVIKTAEIIRILESGPVKFVSTTHSQKISISLDDGRCFRGVYVPAEAPENYRKNKNLHDILNLSEYIKKKRWFRTWQTICE